ncbi:MAG TPA: M13 family metallopeptidase, partial [Pyrinomonadaceae bacterium]|nr:M13 family metallopeptidase [Pyrinomonadaceae bacterium]
MYRNFFRPVTAAAVLFSFCFGAFAQSKGFDVSRMDRSIDACDDFFEYANGTWLKSTQIPASETRWGTFNILADRNNTILREVLETAAKTKNPKGSDAQLIGDFYSSCMDEAAINKAGTRPIKPFLDQIDKIRTTNDLQKQIAELHNSGIPAVFGFGGGPDLKDSNSVIANAGQGGLSLPNRDYYTNTDEKSVEIRTKFVEHVANMFKLLGENADQAATDAKEVLDIQTRLAKASLTPVERRNPDNNYNKITVAAAQEITPNFSWQSYLTSRNAPAVGEMNIVPPKFFTEVNSMLRDTSIESWKTYLRWMTLNAASTMIAKPFADEHFNFFDKYLGGQKEPEPRWKTCVEATDGNLGEALGFEYAKRAFTPAAKARMNELIDNLMASLKNRIDHLDWMSDATKAQAQVKLSTFKRKIGYTDNPRGYKGLTIDKDYAGNELRSNRFQIQRNFADIGKPRDKTRFGFTPPTVNASYSPVDNTITFPAGILQPPFFNFEADDAINYGAIGGVIGHEVTH